MNRRSAMTVITAVGGAVVGGVISIPALLAAITPAFQRRQAAWRPIGRLQDFPLGAVEKALAPVGRSDNAKTLQHKAVYVWRRSADADDIVVYSRNCTDLGCLVNFDPGSECFFCPCHGGIFAKDGRPLAGPPAEPLYQYDYRVRGDQLEIDLRSLPPMT